MRLPVITKRSTCKDNQQVIKHKVHSANERRGSAPEVAQCDLCVKTRSPGSGVQNRDDKSARHADCRKKLILER